MTKEIIKLVIALAVIAGAIFAPDYRDYLNPLVGLVIGYYFATRTNLLATTKFVFRIKDKE